jgi:site-specific recombinase XerD
MGKPNKWREVPPSDSAVHALRAHLDIRERCTEIFDADPDALLIAKRSLEPPLTQVGIYEVPAAPFKRCASNVSVRDQRAAERIREASSHWLRHTLGSQIVALGMPHDMRRLRWGTNA